MVDSLEFKLRQYNSAISRIEVYESLRKKMLLEIEKSNKELEDIKVKFAILLKTNDLFVSFSEAYKKLTVERIESLITEGIQTILKDRNVSFRFKIENKRNNLDISFKIFDSLLKRETDLLNGECGGIKNIVAVLLRIILIVLSTPEPTTVILDEVGTGVSEEHREDFGLFLKELSKKIGIQIVFITHLSEVASQADSIITVIKDKEISRVI